MKQRIENPLLHYHLFGLVRNRWKRQPLLYTVVVVGSALTYLLVYLLIPLAGFNFYAALWLCLFLMCLSAPLMAYNLFSLEYEKQTWESLALTRLTAKEIFWGKWGTALARVAGLTVLTLPLLILMLGAPLEVYISGPLVGKYRTLLEPTHDLYVFSAGVLLLFSSGALIVSLGVWLSFKLRRTLTTASALYAGQVFVLVLLPILHQIFSRGNTGEELFPHIRGYWGGFTWWATSLLTGHAILYLNPFFVASTLEYLEYIAHDRFSRFAEDYSRGLIYMNWGFAQSFIYLALALFFAGLTYRGLKHEWRK